MYRLNHSGNNLVSSRDSFSSERNLFLQAGNGPGDSGLVLSTDAKPRLKWTPELHERFVETVNQLGGAESKYKTEKKNQVQNSILIDQYTIFSCRGHT